MKRIVICADGTWDSPERDRTTNVLKVARSIAPLDDHGNEQVVFYDWGVGADRKKISGGVTGAGLNKNIVDGYRFIVHNYDPGDELFFFGFSRGAYTVRSLAGFIRNCGVLKRQHAHRIPEAFNIYRKRPKSSEPDAPGPTQFRADFAVADRTPIKFVGVWDTVGALGIPIPHAGSLGDKKFFFHDTEPSRIIQCARHAVAMGERRRHYEPVLWTPKPGLDLLQVWFAGVHSDIGGAFTDSPGLGDLSAKWVLDEAAARKLKLETHIVGAFQPDFQGKLHESFRGFFQILGEGVRNMRPTVKKIVIEPVVHRSVKDRWDNDPAGQAKKKEYKALRALLDLVNGDWSRIQLTP